MSVLTQDLKEGRFRPVYLFYGEDAYQRNRCRDAVRNACAKDLDDMNISRFTGKDVNVSEIMEIARTLPFFADRRVILIENSELFGSSQAEELADFLPELPETTILIFTEEHIDKRSRLYKACDKCGMVQVCETLKGAELENWVLALLKRDGKRIGRNALNLFIEKTDSDMVNMRTELEKLVCYLGDREEVYPEDVEAVCHTRPTSKVFDLVEAIARKESRRALDIYREMLELRESPNMILYLIARQFNLILMACELKKQGLDKYRMAEKMGVQPFVVDKCLSQMRGFSAGELQTAVDDCLEMDYAIKSGQMNATLGAEMIIVKYSQKAN